MIFVHALGTAQIDAGEARVTPASARRFALLLHLAAEKGRRVSRSTLHDLIFPDQNEKNARHSLRQLLYQLRQTGVSVISDSHGAELPEHLVLADYASVTDSSRPTAMQLQAIERGFLPGYAPTHSEAFAEWYEGYRARAVFELCKAMLRELGTAKSVGDWEATQRAAQACLALDPINEEATLALAEVLAISGSKVQAVRLLDRYIDDTGRNPDLKISATVLRRRISERNSSRYAGAADSFPFVGREAEMAALQDAAQRAFRGSRRCVLVSGEPGIGKSRLIEEFSAWANLTAASVVTLTVREHERSKPFALVAELSRQLLTLPGSLACQPRAMEDLNCFLAAETQGARNARPGQLTAGALTWALCDVVEAVLAETPLVLLCDDAQWLDRASAKCLYALARTAPTSRLLIAVATRDRSMWQTSPSGNVWDCHLQVPALSVDAVGRFITRALDSESRTHAPDIASWISSVSGGNPLFLSTIIRHYRRTGQRFSVPSDLTELLERRVETVGSDALRLLRFAAILGKHATINRVAQAIRIDGTRILSAIEELEQANLIRPSSTIVAPAHPLVADAALGGCSPLWLATAHRLAAQALSGAPGDEDAATRWACADQWARAGEHERSAVLFEQIAQDAERFGQPLTAAETFARALSLSASAETRRRIARQLILTGDIVAEAQFVSAGSDALRDLGFELEHDDVELAVMRGAGNPSLSEDELVRRFIECITCPSASADHQTRAAIQALKFADGRGRDDLINLTFQSFASEGLDAVARTLQLEFAMIAAAVTLRNDEAVHMAQELVTAARDEADPLLCRHQLNAGLVLVRAGRDDDALEMLNDCIAEARRIKSVEIQVRAQLFRIGILMDARFDAVALDELRECEAIIARDLNSLGHAQYVTLRIDMALALEDVAIAKRLIAGHGMTVGYFDGATGERWRTVFAARIQQLESPNPLSNDVVGAIGHQRPWGASPGVSDCEAAVICFEHLRRGDVDQALASVQRYLVCRRWRSRLSRWLSDAITAAMTLAAKSLERVGA